MIRMILQSIRYRKFKNILLIVQFTIGFAALLFGLGCVNNVLQYKKNVEGLAALDTVHISILEDDDEYLENPAARLPEYRNVYEQVHESGVAEKIGFFELMRLHENPKDIQDETRLYTLNEDCIAMSNLPLEEGSTEPLKNYDRSPECIPVVVSSSMKRQYKVGNSYPFYYVNSESFKYEKILLEVVGVLAPSIHFWNGGGTILSGNLLNNREFILAPQFIDFTEDITYSMNSLLQLSGSESEKEKKLDQIQTIFHNNQLELQYMTLQEEVDAYYEKQKVVFIGTLTFAAILLVLSLLGCVGAILAGITARYREFGIYYAMGFTKRNMIFLVQGEIMVLFGFSFLIATVLSRFLFEAAIAHSAELIDLPVIFTAFVIMLVCIVLCSVMPFLKLKKIEPIEMIKGENR